MVGKCCVKNDPVQSLFQLLCQNPSVNSVYVCCCRLDAWKRRIKYKCLGPVEWRPDVDGKMGKNWIPLNHLILCSLLILVGVTIHDSREEDIAKMAWFNVTECCLNSFFCFLVVLKWDKLSSYHQVWSMGCVLGGASCQICLWAEHLRSLYFFSQGSFIHILVVDGWLDWVSWRSFPTLMEPHDTCTFLWCWGKT